MIKQLLALPRRTRLLITVLADVATSLFAVWFAFALRFEEFIPLDARWVPVLLIAPLLTIPIFVRAGLYRSLIRHFSLHVVWVITVASLLSMTLWGLIAWQLTQPHFPRSVALIAWLLLFAMTFFTRFVMHALYMINRKEASASKVAVYGTGSTALQLASMIEHDPHHTLVGFIASSENDADYKISGSKVYAPSALPSLIAEHGLEYVLLNRNNRQQYKKGLEFLADYPLKLRAVESLSDAVAVPAGLRDLEDIGIEELLGRGEVEPDEALLKQGAHNRSVLVTGAGGSIGGQLCRYILSQQPRKLLLLEQSENALFTIYRELQAYSKQHGIDPATVVPLLGSVEDDGLVREIIRKEEVCIVYHAAAYKHVSLVESNGLTGIRNNVFGTRTVAVAAAELGVKHFILISTDKAVEPANIMGASKSIAEKMIQVLATRYSGTCFCAVRFGNVLGSSGSVVPIFKEQIRRGEALTVTDPEAERYFMSISEATELVIQAGSMANSGDLFLLDMGEPIKIDDIAKKMIHLSGLSLKNESNPNGDIEIRYIGLQHGEKLHEKLYLGDDPIPTQHPKIVLVKSKVPDYQSFMQDLEELENALRARQDAKIIHVLSRLAYGVSLPKTDKIR